MMRRLLTILAIAMLLCCLPQVASAHVLKSDGPIGAVLHISPDDNPISQEAVTYQLVFNDTTGRFKLPDCTCSVSILDSTSQLIKKLPLQPTHALDSTNSFTFPAPDVYTVRVQGQPKPGKQFREFTLSYTVRVSSGGVQFQAIPPLLWVGIGGIVVLALLAAYKEDRNNTKHTKKR